MRVVLAVLVIVGAMAGAVRTVSEGLARERPAAAGPRVPALVGRDADMLVAVAEGRAHVTRASG